MSRGKRGLRTAIVSAAACMASLGWVPAARAATYHHMHLAASSAEDGVRWYTRHLGCQPWLDRKDGCLMNATIFVFTTRGATGGSAGTGVDHLAFSFPDAGATMKALASAGVKVVRAFARGDGPFASGLVEDPWGTRIEVLQDPLSRGLHHIHLASANPDAALTWYQNAFGGERATLAEGWTGLRYGTLWLIASRTSGVLAPSEGRAIDHLSWEAKDLDAEAAAMKQRGVAFREEPRPLVNQLGQRQKTSVLDGPDGVRIDLVQPQA